MNRTVIMLLLVICQVFGDLWISRGMREIGPINSVEIGALLMVAVKFLTSPWIWLGIAFLICSLLLYLAAMSRFDLSYVIPMTAFTYVLSTAMAILILREQVSAIRLLGTCVITAGAFVVGWDDRKHQS
ncbi:hypothetical protein H6F51_18455 [Cyanobacteria bacterium FACHB-DQ100]|uniref:hypothetical protein n=2 Tax=Leptolyngbya TaxID=47251 RepID=UPI0016817469|nr:hypothetical protein [Leptolyngbya sp. FACHB-17]MBD1824454.1 hypothetical protein [Cyanobacteria bacterium FACHB-DQ100]MBD2081008.1 hypothetical protein [Leptolyngbya sp. FACHB-17]